MKKLFTMVVLVLALTLVGKAQTPIFSESFDSGIPSTWVNIDADGDGHYWLNLDVAGHLGEDDACVTSQSYINNVGPLSPDNWLVTPAITIPASGLYELTFWVSAQDASYPEEHYGLYITTSNDVENPNVYTLIYEETLNAAGGDREQGTWKQKSVFLNDYAGQTIHIAFRHFDTYDQYCINLDDVQINLASTDPIIRAGGSLTFPTGTIGSTFPRGYFSVSAFNLTEDVTITLPEDAPFLISTDTVSNFSHTVTLPVIGSSVTTTNVYVKFEPSVAGYYESRITIASAGAESKYINLLAMAVYCGDALTIPWFENFSNTTFPPSCWEMVSLDTADYESEGQVYPGVKRYTWFGSASSRYASVVGDAAREQDEHLYTPTFNLSNATGAADFTFEFRTNPNIDALINGDITMALKMSLNDGATWATVWEVADIREAYAANWTSWDNIWPVKLNMDDYVGTNNQIKFDFVFTAIEGAADQMIIQNVKFDSYQDPRMAINADDTMNFFSYVGDPEVQVISIEGRNLNVNSVVTASENFQVSANGTDFAATANIPAAGGDLYIRYNPATATSDNGTIEIVNNYTDPTETYADTTFRKTIVVIGNSYDCSVVTVPFTQGFESVEGSVLAPDATEYCWSSFKLNLLDAQNTPVNSNNYAYEGNQSFRFSSAKFNNERIYDQYLITPELNSEVPMMVSFNYANASALKDETFAVGFSTTDDLLTSFIWEDDIVNSGNTDWQLYRNLNVPANVKYVAIHYKSDHQAYLYIDNFQVKPVPTCPAPVQVKAESTGEISAKITWLAGADEGEWDFVWGIAPLNIETAIPVSGTNTELSISSLAANTHYQFAVRAVCGEEENSEWSEILDFWTTTTPATVPYTQTFEDNDQDRANWVLVNNGQPNFFKYMNIPGSSTGKGLAITKDGTSNMYLTQVGESYTSRYSTVWAYRDILFPEVAEGVYGYLLSFDWKCNGEADFDFGEVYIGNATAVTNFDRNEEHEGFVDVNETHYTPAGLTQLGSRLQGETTIKHANYLIPAEGNEGMVKRIYFLWTNDSLSGSETPLGVDNVKIEVPVFASLTGYVVDENEGTPIAGANITIASANGFTASTVSEADGSYLINNIVADYYTISAEAAGYDPYEQGLNFSEGENEYNISMSIAPCAIIPTNVVYEEDDINLILTWDNIEGGVMSQSASDVYNNAVGTGASGNFGCYHLFTPSDLNAYNGCTINSIGAYFNGDLAYCTYTLRIWIGGNTDPSSDEYGPSSDYPVYEQVIAEDDITVGAWSDIALTTPFEINGSQNLWIGYQLSYSGAPESLYPAGTSGTTNEGRGNAMYFNGSWTTLSQAGLDGDWLIHATTVAPELTYSVFEDGELIESGIEGGEYIVDNYDPNACYQVMTTCENGQTSELSECARPVSIANIDNAISFSVYPNPATEVVTVATSQKAQKVEILNYLGQVIFAQAVQDNTFTLNVANYANGVYFIRLTGEDGVSTQKLVKK